MLLLFAVQACLAQAGSRQLILANKSTSRFVIVIPDKPAVVERNAAEKLAEYIHKVSGARLSIVKQSASASVVNTIIISRSESVRAPDGFMLQSDAQHLRLLGGQRKGVLYGAYYFIEKYLGCQLYAADAYYIPKKEMVVVPAGLQITEQPAFEYRTTFSRELVTNAEYPDWHGLYNIYDFKRGVYDFEGWGLFVHTFDKLVPANQYFTTHPEYFAMVKGQRVRTQLCLSSPAVLSIAIRNLAKEIQRRPDLKYWSVSQNDNFDYCTCNLCANTNRVEGGPQGTIIRFVNKMAAAFPDKTISTLAYQYSRSAPKKTVPAKNVNIMLCYQVDRVTSITQDSASRSFINDLNDWMKLTHNIFIWDYVVQFTNLLAPYPNFNTLQANMQYFKGRGVAMMFPQGWDKAAFSELRTYLLAKLMWNPNINFQRYRDDFLTGYYGSAAAAIRSYIEMSEQERAKSGQVLEMFGNINNYSNTFLRPELLQKYNALFNEAEFKVKQSPEMLQRVRTARLSIEYVEIETIKQILTNQKQKDARAVLSTPLRKEYIDRLKKFVDICKSARILQMNESGKTLEEYEKESLRLVE